MKRIVYGQLVRALESHSLISNCQFSFHSKHSTTPLLLQAVHDWAGSLEHCSSTHCLFFDLVKAFDLVLKL